MTDRRRRSEYEAFPILEPQSVDEACQLLGELGERAKVMAGGQSLVVLLKHRLTTPEYLLGIKDAIWGAHFVGKEAD